jgi:hypothetical protein
MISLIYVSSAVKPFSPSELSDLLTQCHTHNTSVGVTGMLLYKDGDFMQVLEGEQETVQTLYSQIGRDPRHRRVLKILQSPLAERQFNDWSMGFRDLNGADALATPGYSEFLNVPLTGEEFSADPTRSQQLLLTFKMNTAPR